MPTSTPAQVLRRSKTVFLLVAPVVLLAGCDPCSGWTGPEFADPDGLAGADALTSMVRVHDEFLAWTGTDRVCVRDIELANLADDASELVGPAGIRVDPHAASPETELRRQLCVLLDSATSLSDEAPDLFSSRDEFSRACALGPPTFGWEANGCVEDSMSEIERFLVDRVYPYAPVTLADGSLSVALAEPMHVDGVGFMLLDGAGDQIAVVRGSGSSAETSDDTILVDPLTGTITSVFPLGDASYMLLGGLERAAVIETRDDLRTMYVVEAATGTVTSTPTDFEHHSGHASVGDSALYAAEYRGSTLRSVDLATGEVIDLALPAPKAPLQAYAERVLAVPGGVLVMVYDSEAAEVGSADLPPVDSYAMYRYAAATGRWDEQFRDLPFIPLGVTSGGLVLGLAGETDQLVYAAWKLDTRELFVSDDLCVADVRAPWLYAADRGWYFTGTFTEPESLMLQAMEFQIP